MNKHTISALFLIVALLLVSSIAYGQRGSYMDFIRPDVRPPLVGSAFEADSLWGSMDESERGDGIAESRRAELEELVRRFTPTVILPPGDYIKLKNHKYRLYPIEAGLILDTLRIDEFKTAPYEFYDSLNIPFRELDPDSLVALVETAVIYLSDPHVVSTWYFDFPGENPGEWWDAYGKFRTGPDSALWAQPAVYAHPFVDERGRLVIQYWYCYPFNDFVGNHE